MNYVTESGIIHQVDTAIECLGEEYMYKKGVV